MIAIGDIESFFNENFFKKVPVQERKIDHRHSAVSDAARFNGAPETHYEPFYNTYIPYNETQSKKLEEEAVQPSKPTFSNRPNYFNRDIPEPEPIIPKPYDFDLGEKKSVPYKSSNIEDNLSSTTPNFQREYDFKIGAERPTLSKSSFTKQQNKFSLDKEMKDFNSQKLDGIPQFPKKNVFDEHSSQVR